MSEQWQLQEMHRGYARTPHEEAILAQSGLKPERIWLEGRGAEALGTVDLRKGDLLKTVHGLRALGDSRQDIVSEVERIHGRGAVVVDVETGQRSDRDGVAMLDAAIRRIRGEAIMPPGKAEKMQRASVRARTKGRLSQREALVFWRDARLTNAEAIAKMTGWSERNAYVVLGSRGLPTGRRAK